MAEATVTELLRQLSMGQQSAEDKLLPLVYGELKRMAHRQLKSERPGHTLNTTALVHEAYLRLGLERISWQDRVHFFAVAARAMRRVLIDYAEARRAEKRGGGAAHVTLDETVAAPERRVDDLLALDEALNRLEKMDPRQVSSGRMPRVRRYEPRRHGHGPRHLAGDREPRLGARPRLAQSRFASRPADRH